MNISFSSEQLCDLLNHLTAVMLLLEDLLEEGISRKEREKALLEIQKELFAMKDFLVVKNR